MEHAHRTMRNARARHRGDSRHLALEIQVSRLGTGLKEMWCDKLTKVLGTHDTITTYKWGYYKKYSLQLFPELHVTGETAQC